MRITIKPFVLRGFNLAPEIPHITLRVYALNSFVAQSDDRIVQPGAPSESPFYEEWQCTRQDSELHLPQIEMESTIDAVSPAHPESLRYYAAFFDRDNYICPYWPKPVFALDAYPNPTTWAHIIAYNSPGVEFDWTTEHADHFSKEEFDYLLQNPPAIVIGGITVLPPLQFDGTTLWIPKASAIQDGYISKEDFALFAGGGTGVGTVTEIDAGTGLEVAGGGPITTSGTLRMADIPGVQGTYFAPHVTVNPQGQITFIESTAGGDATPPVITNVHYSGLGPTAVTILWDTDDPADSRVEYGFTASYGLANSNATLVQGTHSLPLTGLTPSHIYHFRVSSIGPSGTAIGADVTFTTTGVADTIPPVLSAEVPTPTSSSVIITWTTNEAADSQVAYGTTSGYGSLTPITQLSGVTNHSVTITDLTPGVTYHYQCRSRDISPAQNLGASVGDHLFTTATVDLPPIISDVHTGTPGTTNVTILWTTNENADSKVEYGTTTAYEATPVTNITKVTGHAIPLSALTPGIPYHYRVSSTDLGGNTTVDVDRTFTTAPSETSTGLMAGLMSYWKMDEASGTRFDAHGPNDLTMVTAVTMDTGGRVGNCAAGIGGDDTLAYGPDGGSYLGCAYDASQDMPGDFTVTGWMWIIDVGYLTELPCLVSSWITVGGMRSFIVLYNFLGHHYQFSISSDGANQADLYIPASAPNSGWSFYCARYEAATATMRLRVDTPAASSSLTAIGPAVDSTTSVPFAPGPVYPAPTGIQMFGFDTYKRTHGRLDEIGIWKRLLTNAEVDSMAAFPSYPFGPSVDLTTGLVSYWKLDEASGTRFDAHGINHFTTITNPVGGLTVGPGRLGNCPHFPSPASAGGGVVFTCPDSPSQATPGDFAITGWMKVDVVAGYDEFPVLLSKWSTSDHGFLILYNPVGDVAVWTFTVSSDGTNQHDCSIEDPDYLVPFDGLWHFLCAQYDATLGELSFSIDNGTPATLSITPGAIHQSHADLKIGSFDVYSDTHGYIDEIAFYNRLLTPDEITALFGAPTYPLS